jgi:hypothetical protein
VDLKPQFRDVDSFGKENRPLAGLQPSNWFVFTTPQPTLQQDDYSSAAFIRWVNKRL